MHPLSPFTSANLILLFHSVRSKAWFADTLRRVGQFYRFVSVEDVESYYYGDRTLTGSCHVTFDDGERTVYENALPVLRDMKIPATVFVSPGVVTEGRNYWFQELRIVRAAVGDARVKEAICDSIGCTLASLQKYSVLSLLKCMNLAAITSTIGSLKARHAIRIEERFNVSVAELREMIDSGAIAVGGHTINHPILSNESDETAEREIRESLEGLSGITGSQVKYFSPPNGSKLDYGDRETAILERNGVKLTFTYSLGFFGRKSNPMSLPRAAFSMSRSDQNRAIVPKILLVPVWGGIRYLVRLGRTEERERLEVRKHLLPARDGVLQCGETRTGP
ncbi:MAG: polysaccharide deacetylase family protein [Candidatus Eisenbacteria bacterium]|nr:polysaccharide deacetylase family protein [Candidatus Eisenbacteria bacterium]